jgi:glyoxylase-like metal-dependent hydrolase (beta-lactamase superfamily II)
VCEDERQFVPVSGQEWTTLEALQETHDWELRELERGCLWGIGMVPRFAIGQRALLIRTASGNLLWDCISLIDDGLVEAVQALGGIDAIAVSHPHFHASMVEWSREFGGAPIYIHEADLEWVQRRHDALVAWSGETHELAPELTFVRTGGHFPGFQCLVWSAGADGKGALMSGDQPHVCADRRYLSFMYSYPNHIPLGPDAVRHTRDALAPFPFDRIYGAWWDRVIADGGKQTLVESADRHLRAIGAGADIDQA